MFQTKLGFGAQYKLGGIHNQQSTATKDSDTTIRTRYGKTLLERNQECFTKEEQIECLNALELVAYDRSGLFERLCDYNNMISIISIKSAIHYDSSLRRMTAGLLFFLIPSEQCAAKLIKDNFQVLFPGDSQIAIGDLSDAIEKLRTSIERNKLSFASDKSSAI